MTSNPLRPEALLQAMADALPNPGDGTSAMSSSYEALALFTHACMTSLGFRLLGFNEDQKMESECQSCAPRLPSKWNASFNSHSFLYAHGQSSMNFVIKVDRLGGKAEIRGLGVGDERINRLEVAARDYISSAALPVRISTTEESQGEGGGEGGGNAQEDRTDLPDKLRRVFISDERVADLATLIKINIIQKLVPGLQKEGYQESEDPDDREARRDADRAGRVGPRQPPRAPGEPPDPARPYPHDDPLAAPPRRPVPAGDFPPPDFEDEYEINRPPRGGPLPGFMPGLGHDDLYPPGLGPHDPLRPTLGGGGLPRPGGPSGMHPTPHDPLFGGRGGSGDGDGFDPQVPPGARFDPLGPPGAGPRFGGGRGRGPFGGGGPGGVGFGGFGGGDII
ncbi:uncharacterized protein E0L32_000550 [Thyridium curvatum]|uniref:Uncharacterized protein n=1 Tax=Thyridium curvatum TaxID=1093900 RepID=A0A507B4Z5_9PEZI|nr:uncharacterized protein E0L32_000550 [Thyridium curvatum]TPX14156.1 hypothetical protein E0L32_000550 [Thyridium curvatum]